MNYLLSGGYNPQKLELLISLTSIRSEDVIGAIRDHLIKGASIEAASQWNYADAGNTKRALKKLNEVARIVEECKNIDLYKNDPSKQVTLVTNKKPARSKKPDAWKDFFKAYPEGKKGGVDASAWKAAKSEGLEESDFSAMLEDVIQRGNLMPSWRKTYAQGIVKYIRDRIWLTPITPERGTLREVQLDAFGDELRNTRDISTNELVNDRSWAD